MEIISKDAALEIINKYREGFNQRTRAHSALSCMEDEIKALPNATAFGYDLSGLLVVATMMRDYDISAEDIKQMVEDGRYCVEKWFEILNESAERSCKLYVDGDFEIPDEEPDDSNIEVGFDPFVGGYTDDV